MFAATVSSPYRIAVDSTDKYYYTVSQQNVNMHILVLFSLQ
jgi:hypothetical protein